MTTVINIKRGKLLEPYFQAYVLQRYPDYQFPPEDEISEKIKIFKAEFVKSGEEFLNFLSDTTGLSFKRNIIDCYIVSATTRDMSAPLIIRSRWSAEEFMDVIMHELIHALFSDNKIEKIENKWNTSESTINHVMVFSLLKKFYLEVLKSEDRLKNIVSKSGPDNNVDYYNAWQIVDEVGFENIIQEIKG